MGNFLYESNSNFVGGQEGVVSVELRLAAPGEKVEDLFAVASVLRLDLMKLEIDIGWEIC